MKFQAWLKLPNSASHFTTDLLQMHHDSHSWVHWTQGKFEEDQSFTCVVFRKDWACTVPARSQKPCGTASQGSPWGRTDPSAPLPDVFVVTHQGRGPAGKSANLKVWLNRVHSQAGMGQGWGHGHLQLGWGQSQRLSWNGVHFNTFHSAKSSS